VGLIFSIAATACSLEASSFEQGRIDTWAIWDSFYGASEVQLGAKTLVTSERLAANRDFFKELRVSVAL
jgi:hypothetical protein